MIDVKTCINDSQEKMDMAIMYLEEALAHIRAGKQVRDYWTESVWILTEVWYQSATWQL